MIARKLIVMRHAKSSWDSDAPDDYARPLAARGRRDARLMGEWLGARGDAPAAIVSSPAERTRQTTGLVAAAIGLACERIEWCEAIYEAELAELLQVLQDRVSDDALMIVGHNPGMESLVRYLDPDIGRHLRGDKLMPTAAVLGFELTRPDALRRPGGGELLFHGRPKTVRAGDAPNS